MYLWRKYITAALACLLLLACRKDDLAEIPEPVYRIRLESSGVTLPGGGSAVIPFRIADGELPKDSGIRLLLRDGTEPSEFCLEGIETGSDGLCQAKIADTGISGAYSREACLSLSFRSSTGRDVIIRSEYLAVNCGPTDFSGAVDTGLPVVFVDVSDGRTVNSRDIEYPAVMKIKGAGGYAGRTPVSCTIRGRGNTTWIWPKKPYQIEFRERLPMLGMPAARRWILLANFADKTLMRNMVSMKVSSLTSMDWTPRCVPVELVLDGEHRGSYLMIEKVEVDPERVALSPDGCLLELDFHYDNEVQWFDPHGLSRRRTGIPFAIKYPSGEDLTPQREASIKKYVTDAADVLYSSGFADPDTGYAAWLDVDSFIDYWIIFEVLGNHELGNPGSVYFHREAGGKLIAGPCWDFDWGLLKLSTTIQSRTGIVNKGAIWYARLFQDPAFEQKVRERFLQLLPELETVPQFIDESERLLAASAEINFKMWNPSVDRWQNNGLPVNGDENLSFGDAVARLRQVYLDRLDLLKNNL
ncbi:MAG: CotH kinase family protein [Bacteroidales bacterium]|nr:CotH kinase family protein [Bacteroidales bacterium]